MTLFSISAPLVAVQPGSGSGPVGPTGSGTRPTARTALPGTTDRPSSQDPSLVMQGLLRDGALTAGTDKLHITYYSQRICADLLPDGQMQFQGQRYSSPAQVALEMKKTINKDLKFDSGWGTCISSDHGKTLRVLRDEWMGAKRVRVSPRESAERPSKFRAISSTRPAGGSSNTNSTPAVRAVTRTRSTTAVVAADPQEERGATPQSSPRLSPSKERAMSHKRGFSKLCKICFTADRKEQLLQCDACARMYHIQCLEPPLQELPEGPWFCTSCFAQQEATVRPFLECLRTLLRSDTMASQRDELARLQPSFPQQRQQLLLRVDELLNQLDNDAHKMLIFAHSTGEMLVHMTKMDLPKGLSVLIDQLQAVASNRRIPPLVDFQRAEERQLSEHETTTQNLVHGVDILHQLATGKTQIHQTVAVLEQRTQQLLSRSAVDLARQQTERETERQSRENTAATMEQLSSELPALKQELGFNQRICDSLTDFGEKLHHRVSKQHIPRVYHRLVSEMGPLSREMVRHLLQEKMQQICERLVRSKHEERHFNERLQELQAAPETASSSSVVVALPPNARLVQRQVCFLQQTIQSSLRSRTPLVDNLGLLLDVAEEFGVDQAIYTDGLRVMAEFSAHLSS